MEFYKTHDVAKAFDLAPQTIRFYEAEGIIRPTKAENGYRVFDALSFKRLVNLKYYQSMGFTVRESADIIKNGTSKTMVDKLKQKWSEVEKIADWYKLLLEEMREQISELENIESKLYRPTIVWSPSFFLLVSQEERNVRLEEMIVRKEQEWMRKMPFVRQGCLIEKDHLESEEAEKNRISGLVVEETRLRDIRLSMDETARFFPSRLCIHFYTKIEGKPTFSNYQRLKVAMGYISDHNFSIDGDILGRLVFVEKEGCCEAESEDRIVYYEYFIPIR